MANNRLWLLHPPSNTSVFLGKRMGFGWYFTGTDAEMGAALRKFFDAAEDCEDEDQDRFVLGMEDIDHADAGTFDIHYEQSKPVLDNRKGKLNV